tara:strand:- start:148 stop:606 length:459 start_codon:yes stop_codon:yes gene_type:complete
MSRKTRIDSTAAAIAVAKASSQAINPPSNVPLKDCDLPFFASVIDEFARSEWTAHQLELAAMLARKMRLLRDELDTLEDEGFSLAREGQAPCQNPRLGGVRMLDTSIMATRRTLQLHARARGGETRDVAKRRDAVKEIEGGAKSDDLLARPN